MIKNGIACKSAYYAVRLSECLPLTGACMQDLRSVFVYRHFIIADGVGDIHIMGISFINGLASSAHSGNSGGCLYLGHNVSLTLRNVTFQNCSAPGSGGRGGAIFVGKQSTLVLESSVISDGYAGGEAGGVFSDEYSILNLTNVSFMDFSVGFCPDPQTECVSYECV